VRAQVDKVEHASLPPHAHCRSQRAWSANPLIIRAYAFTAKGFDKSQKHPLIVFCHQEFTPMKTRATPTCCASSSSRAISFLDAKRVGIIGWSHGGLIALMNIFQHPKNFAMARAGVPASDLAARMVREPPRYAALYSAPYHTGESVGDDVMEYRKRSPVYHAKELATPLLIHANTNEDVNVLEVEHLIDALKAEGKKFEYKIYQDATPCRKSTPMRVTRPPATRPPERSPISGRPPPAVIARWGAALKSA
jgi:dienelactone hydrolase